MTEVRPFIRPVWSPRKRRDRRYGKLPGASDKQRKYLDALRAAYDADLKLKSAELDRRNRSVKAPLHDLVESVEGATPVRRVFMSHAETLRRTFNPPDLQALSTKGAFSEPSSTSGLIEGPGQPDLSMIPEALSRPHKPVGSTGNGAGCPSHDQRDASSILTDPCTAHSST